jgi:hypothetical protein
MRWTVTRKMFKELKSKNNLKIRNHFAELPINDEIILNWINPHI